MKSGVQILSGILTALLTGFAVSAIMFIDTTKAAYHDPVMGEKGLSHSYLSEYLGPMLLTMVAIPVTVAILTYMQFSGHRWRTVFAVLSLVAGLTAFFFVVVFVALTIQGSDFQFFVGHT